MRGTWRASTSVLWIMHLTTHALSGVCRETEAKPQASQLIWPVEEQLIAPPSRLVSWSCFLRLCLIVLFCLVFASLNSQRASRKHDNNTPTRDWPFVPFYAKTTPLFCFCHWFKLVSVLGMILRVFICNGYWGLTSTVPYLKCSWGGGGGGGVIV